MDEKLIETIPHDHKGNRFFGLDGEGALETIRESCAVDAILDDGTEIEAEQANALDR
jgi:hypothetical protein